MISGGPKGPLADIGSLKRFKTYRQLTSKKFLLASARRGTLILDYTVEVYSLMNNNAIVSS